MNRNGRRRRTAQNAHVNVRLKEVRMPESLFRLCLTFVAENLDDLCKWTPNGFLLGGGVSLPREVCNPLFELIQCNGRDVFDVFQSVFRDLSLANLSSVHLRNSEVTDDDLLDLLKHNLDELKLSDCCNLTHKTYTNVLKNAGNLHSLTIGPNVSITPQGRVGKRSLSLDGISMRTSKLKRLALLDITESWPFENVFLGGMIKKLVELRVLDLSLCTGVGSLYYLRSLKSLTTLVLYNVPKLEENNAFTNICALKSLVVLDISSTRYYEPGGFGKIYKNENMILSQLMECLPNLISLDISGTNLAGEYTAVSSTVESNGKKCDIAGLQCRVNNPLKFLGLYNTLHNACQRLHIPARIMSGNANEEQLLNAAAASIDKLSFSIFILNDFLHLVKFHQCSQFGRALKIVLEVLERHVENEQIQALVVATLHYIVKNMVRLGQLIDITLKRTIITTIIEIMLPYSDELMIMKTLRHGLMTLFSFVVPQDLMFVFKHLVKLLFRIISLSDGEDFQKAATFLLLSLSSKASLVQKIELGNTEAVKELMSVIMDRLKRNVWDEVFEDACLILWFITKEVPKSCKQFLDSNGIKYCLDILSTSRGNYRQKRALIGLFSNVSEVNELRPRLMTCRIVNLFYDLLHSSDDRMEVTFIAVNVFALMISDGPSAWPVTTPSRDSVLICMTEVIRSWNINAKRTMTFASLESFLKLVQITHLPQCVHFGIWTLANLTKVYPEKYCKMLIAEGGLNVLNDLLKNPNKLQIMKYDSNVIRGLAKTVIGQCLTFTNRLRPSGPS